MSQPPALPRARVQYVLGFVYDMDCQRVLLIRKNRPASLAGKLNGLGGKVEPTDPTPEHALSREVLEESGVSVRPDQWEDLGWMTTGKLWDCLVFRACIPLDILRRAYTCETEDVMIYEVDVVPVQQTLQSALAYIHLGRTGRAKAEITWKEDER
jgi:8-oxo-dGTP pyrophosphatase MutT (NUDIX family)